MKKILVFVVAVVASYWAWGYYGGFGDPMYAELRVKQADTGVELLGLGQMNSESDCQNRADRFWKRIFVSEQRFEIVSLQCVREVPARFQDLLAKRQCHATYISLEKGNGGERDGSFVIFGVPSSEVARVCPALVQQVKQNYSGKVECVRGSVG